MCTTFWSYPNMCTQIDIYFFLSRLTACDEVHMWTKNDYIKTTEEMQYNLLDLYRWNIFKIKHTHDPTI